MGVESAGRGREQLPDNWESIAVVLRENGQQGVWWMEEREQGDLVKE